MPKPYESSLGNLNWKRTIWEFTRQSELKMELGESGRGAFHSSKIRPIGTPRFDKIFSSSRRLSCSKLWIWSAMSQSRRSGQSSRISSDDVFISFFYFLSIIMCTTMGRGYGIIDVSGVSFQKRGGLAVKTEPLTIFFSSLICLPLGLKPTLKLTVLNPATRSKQFTFLPRVFNRF